jgi:signal peptidase I
MAAGDGFGPWDDRDAPRPAHRVVRPPASRPPPTAARRPAPPSRPAARNRRPTFWQRSVVTHRDRGFWRHSFILLVVLLAAMVLVGTFIVRLDSVRGGAMQATLRSGDRVLVNKLVYDFRDPRRGEVVLFHGTPTWTPDAPADPHPGFLTKLAGALGDVVGIRRPVAGDFIRRVIGVPGDTVACCDSTGRVIINGEGVDEPYVTLNAPIDSPAGTPACGTRRFAPTVVQAGYVFVLGDDRLISQDSRCAGQVPIEDIVGHAVAVAWPSGRWVWLSVPPSFDRVPSPYGAEGACLLCF